MPCSVSPAAHDVLQPVGVRDVQDRARREGRGRHGCRSSSPRCRRSAWNRDAILERVSPACVRYARDLEIRQRHRRPAGRPRGRVRHRAGRTAPGPCLRATAAAGAPRRAGALSPAGWRMQIARAAPAAMAMYSHGLRMIRRRRFREEAAADRSALPRHIARPRDLLTDGALVGGSLLDDAGPPLSPRRVSPAAAGPGRTAAGGSCAAARARAGRSACPDPGCAHG